MSAPALRELQAAFWRSVAGGTPDPRLVRTVCATPSLAPAERLRIYAGMYLWRIVDALREDFPRLAALLGEDGFERLVRAYLARHPSTHPSLRHVGRHLPGFLARRPAVPAYASDLARLEWARLEVFDAPDATPLIAADLRRIPQAEWPDLCLALVPACVTLVAGWPVQEVWAAPAGAGPRRLRRRRTALRVWRDGFRVYHAAMDPLEERALARLGAGRRFAELCDAVGSAGHIAALLLRWVEDGIVGRAC